MMHHDDVDVYGYVERMGCCQKRCLVSSVHGMLSIVTAVVRLMAAIRMSMRNMAIKNQDYGMLMIMY